MKRADRLLQLIQILRRHRRPVTATQIARELEISERTVYRDVGGLVANGVPIRGEAGIGYVLGPGYDLPPLMLTADEVEALVVGMTWVEARADVGLRAAARDVLAKVGAVLPQALAPLVIDRTVAAPVYGRVPLQDSVDVSEIRRAMRERRKIVLDYNDEKGVQTARTIWPLAIGYFELTRVLVAWCELRSEFRHFRTDRMRRVGVATKCYPGSRAKLMRAWRESQKQYVCRQQSSTP